MTDQSKKTCAFGIYMIFFGMMIQAYSEALIWPALSIERGYGVSYTVFLTLTSLFFGSLIPIAAKMCVFLSRKKLYLVSASVYTVCCAAQALPLPFFGLLLLRVAIGCTLAFLFTVGFTLIGDLFSAEERGFWLGVNGVILGLASFICSPFAGFMADQHLIAVVFLLSVPFCGCGILLLLRFLPDFRGEEKRTRFDLKGSFSLCVGLSAFFLFLSAPQRFGSSIAPLLFIAVLLCCCVYFIRHEKKMGNNAVLPLFTIRSRNFRMIFLATFCSAGSAAFFYYSFSYYMLVHMHFSGFTTGISVMLQSLFILFFGPAFTSYLARSGKLHGISAASCLLMTAICLFFALWVGTDTPLFIVNTGMILFGLYVLFITHAFSLAAQNYVSEEIRPYAVGAVHLAQSLGNSITLAIITGILNFFGNDPEFGYDIVYALSIGLVLAVLAASAAIKVKE